MVQADSLALDVGGVIDERVHVDDLLLSVKFHIDARLRVEPSPEVGFETTLELTTGHASIKASKG